MIKFFKKLIFKAYVLFLMAFTVWYGYFMYPLIFGFEGKEGAEISLKKMGDAGTEEEQMFLKLISEQASSTQTDLGYTIIDQPYIEGRFHHIGFNIQEDKGSICIRCHGNVPHDKSKEIRSFLNMHTFYLACETCHATPGEGADPWSFSWYDKDTGDVIGNPPAVREMAEHYYSKEDIAKFTGFGNYGAKVAPGKQKPGDIALLHGEKEIAFVERYIAEQDRLKPEQQSQMKRVIHKRVQQEPVQCKGCHREVDPYIPFAELGYPPRRIDELTNVEVVSMIEKFKKFYIPSLLRPGGID